MQRGHAPLSGAVEGYDIRLVADLARDAWNTGRAPVLCVVADDHRFHTLLDIAPFFAPDVTIMPFPAWDCLPYDRVSPNADIVASRVRFMANMTHGREAFSGPTIIITPIAAAAQRVPDPALFAGGFFELRAGGKLNETAFRQYLTDQGYRRTDTVREAGEFAIRGGIWDIFPPGVDAPVRLDCFDNDIESIKYFDPVEQTTTSTAETIMLAPGHEVLLNPDTISRFRARYREMFGAQQSDDPLFEAVTEGNRYAGMEHWLPLFYDRMLTLFDIVPDNTPLVLDHQMDAVYRDRMGQVADFYNARHDHLTAPQKSSVQTGPKYKPVPPPMLYVMEEGWKHILETRQAVRHLNPFGDDVKQAPHISAHAEKTPSAVYELLKKYITEWSAAHKKTIIACYSEGSRDRLRQLCDEHHVSLVGVDVVVLPLEHGFIAPDMAVLTEQDILGDRLVRASASRKRNKNALRSASELNIGDLVVHIEHGIGKFDGLVTVTVDGAAHDCVRIVYADNDKLFIPVESLDVLTRFGSDQATATLDRLGGVGWQSRKARIKKKLLDMAEGLIALAAKRKTATAPDITIPDGSYHEFVARFPYQETEDQEKSITDVMSDLHAGTAMDRLICGDVGFGKTEVAMRAAFAAAMSGLQVAIVVPTTLLARQHMANFTRRFAGFPIRIAQLSRMVTTSEAKKTRDALEKGHVHIVIGTHALLADSIRFANLGLLIVDEEQNFGVKQKEKLKNLRENVHVLTLTATPIPRTLQLSMTGIRDLSIMATPPVDRLAVRTSVLPFDPLIIREAIMREHHRGGQCFYVVPRLSDMKDVRDMLDTLVPEVKIVEAHGQMSPTDLDERMTEFYEGRYQVLLATNIIESGLDIPNANTLIVHRSDLFGLGQLYQIRGRIGRSKRRAYAYFTYKDEKLLSTSAKQRLHVIGTLDTLGAGFQLASYDMDIRGAGNLLGEEQSGHIKEVGVELYQHMLEEAVRAVREGRNMDTALDDEWSPTINLGLPVLIPDTYVADLPVRLGLYRRLASMTEQADIDAFAAELVDRFGKLPDEVKNLLDVMTIKQYCKRAGIEKIDAGPKGAVVTFRRNTFAAVDRLLDYARAQMGTVKLRPDQKLGYLRAWDDMGIRLRGVRDLARDLADMVA